MKTPIAVLLIVLALVLGAVAGFLYAESMEEEVEAPAAEAVVNPFEETRVNPLEGAGYENPLEEVRFNPFE